MERNRNSLRIPSTLHVFNPRISRSRVTINSFDLPAPHESTQAGSLHAFSTLDGRRRLVCITPSQTRDSWLSRCRSPSTNSSSSYRLSQCLSTRNNMFPNSLSDGALMKRLMVSDAKRNNAEHVITNSPSIELNKKDTNRQEAYNHLNCNIGQLRSTSTSESHSNLTCSRELFSPGDKKVVAGAREIDLEHPQSFPTPASSIQRKTRTREKRRIKTFTEHLLLSELQRDKTKPKGRHFDYPLEAWFATTQPELTETDDNPFKEDTLEVKLDSNDEISTSVPRLNFLSDAVEEIIKKHKLEDASLLKQATQVLVESARKAPIAKIENDDDMRNFRDSPNLTRRKDQKPNETLNENTKQRQNALNPKFVDSRRATPRQVKLNQHTASSQHLNNTNTAQTQDHKDSRANFIRNAGQQFHSTIPKLKRSESGHTVKPVVTERRSSDPFSNENQSTHKVSTFEPTLQMRQTGDYTGLRGPSSNVQVTPRQGRSPSPHVWCSKWSKRLDPPPAIYTQSRHSQRDHDKSALQHCRENKQPNAVQSIIPIRSDEVYPPKKQTFETFDEANLLFDDSVPVGDLGRINFRTGSFMYRYPYSANRSPNSPQETLHHENVFRTAASHHTPLYLTPKQTIKSGNTTRSAPSPSFYPASPTPNSTHPPTQLRTITLAKPSQVLDMPHQTHQRSSIPDLDPVLDRLLLDVSSIDDYRSALKPQMATLQRAPKFVERKIPTDHAPQVDVVAQPRLSADEAAKRGINVDQVESTTTELGQQIRDLINLEFSLEKSRGSPVRTSPRPDASVASGENTPANTNNLINSKPSESEQPPSTAGNSWNRSHPFRWSSGAGKRSYRTIFISNKKRIPKPNIHIQSADSTSEPEKSRAPVASESPSQFSHSALAPDIWNTASKCFEQLTFWELSSNQLSILRKLALVQITTTTQKHCVNRSPFNWLFTKNRSTVTAPEIKNTTAVEMTNPQNEKQVSMENGHPNAVTVTNRVGVEPVKRWTIYSGPVFGQSLENWQQRLGYPLPFSVVHMMDHLSVVGGTAHGIFRRPGRKVRTSALREKIENDLCWHEFDEWQTFDVADLLKQFFRELPECLLTDKLSLILLEVYGNLGQSEQMNLLRWAILSLPDENRTVLQKLLNLLNGLTQFAAITQMNAANLAVCFAPSLFRFPHASNSLSLSSGGLSPRRLRRTTSGPDPKDLANQRTAQHCLATMISHSNNLFEVSVELLRKTHLLSNRHEPRELEMIVPGCDWPSWIQMELSKLLRDCVGVGARSKIWTNVTREAWKVQQAGNLVADSMESIELHYRKPPSPSESKSLPRLRTWRCSTWIADSKPNDILTKFWHQRPLWDLEVKELTVKEQISDFIDLSVLTHHGTPPEPNVSFYLLRGKQSSLEDGGCAMFCESVMPNDLDNIPQTGFSLGHVYADHVYARPESGGCRVYLLSQVDILGHTEEWYAKHWGHALIRRLLYLKRSLRSGDT